MEEYEFGKRVYKQVLVDGKKVGKWVVLIELEDWNEEKLIHRIDASNSYEAWYEYDEDGNLIHKSNNKGEEVWQEFDSKGGVVSWKSNMKRSHDLTIKNKYNSDGKIVFSEDATGKREYEYDENGRCIYTKTITGFNIIYESFLEYSDEYSDHPISEKQITNGELKVENFYERDEKTSWIHKKSIREGRVFNFWADCEYDEDGNLVRKLIYRGM